ncbi:oligoribonuclease [Bacillus sp. SA1-12]|uniref:DHH family phosphoesterase n=1 Tax=Bacillus sp. SA1-12 TaxID=1455638 RepID=UPI0006273F82|nr:DHHA1 domain-containing protein [Bacillus sp. SA1-12]KKI90197.1 oligoribonuclease [Bacillus sp. SA1-12]
MQNLLLTHNDLDGVSCGILAKYALAEKIEVYYHSVNSLNYHVEKFLNEAEGKKTTSNLYITDLSVNNENEIRLNDFAIKGGKIQLIDHHKSALHINKYNWSHIQVEETEGKLASATSLFYQFLIEEKMIKAKPSLNEYVELVRQYDTWEWEKHGNINAKRLNDLLYMQSIEEFEGKMLERLSQNAHFSFDEFEEKVLDIEEKKTDRYIRRKTKELVQANIGKLCVGIVHAESYHSELGNALGKEFPHLDCIVILNMGSKKIGFRTIHDHVDVSKLASTYGGGGHAKAAGCSITKEAYNDFIEKPFTIKPLLEDARHNQYNKKERCAHFENRQEEQFLIYQKAKGKWVIEKNHVLLSEKYLTFELAERFLKRSYSAGLTKDEKLISYLIESYNRIK